MKKTVIKEQEDFVMTEKERNSIVEDIIGRMDTKTEVTVWYKPQDGNPLVLDESGTLDKLFSVPNFVKDLYSGRIVGLKAHLRPIGDMTESEKLSIGRHYAVDFYADTANGVKFVVYKHKVPKEDTWTYCNEGDSKDYQWVFKWLDKHGFDHRGLIKRGLAIEKRKNKDK